MSQKLKISETGLKLIKAFEGYRPVDRELVTGQRIVGYGHRLYSEDAIIMDKSEAEEVLRSDLEPFEDMINSEVHAPISQSQFDALCSFAFNIGPKAFLTSDTLRALNNGRPLDAANGLDVFRKSEIAGKTYVVDALMRRRTAEKALFLRTEKDLPAGREDLPPVVDTTIEGLSTEDAYPVFTEDDAESIVTSAPYSARISPARRREDGPAGVLQLSELDIVEEEALPAPEDEISVVEEVGEPNEMADPIVLDEILDVEDLEAPIELDTDLTEDEALPMDALDLEADAESTVDAAPERSSPIAAAASDIVARLDALIEDVDIGDDDPDAEWPETLLETEILEGEESELDDGGVTDTKPEGQVIDLETRTRRSDEEIGDEADLDKTAVSESNNEPLLVIDELAADDAMRPRTDSAAKYIETYAPETNALKPLPINPLGLLIPLFLGFILFGLAGGTMVRGSQALLGDWGPIIAVTGFVIGTALIIASIYAYLRSLRGINPKHS